jgi:surface polysaccharide O-acyltransferase-like enzyme
MRRLYEIDVVRILTFACVIGVHVISEAAQGDDVGQYGVLILLHFTRQVFFALTTFVLLLGQLNRPKPMRAFWPRRFLLVGVPYLVWSVIYWSLGEIGHAPSRWPADLLGLGREILLGAAWYHLYFLLVTMQVYLLVPVITWLVRRTRGRHGVVLAIAAVVQIANLWLYQYAPDALGWFHGYENQFFWSYPFFILAGAIAVDHAGAFLAWVRAHRAAIAGIVVAGAVVTIGVYALQQLLLGMSPGRAAAAMQPVTVLWGACVGLGFLAIGTWWADRRVEGSWTARAVNRASDRSFGIFLVHPLVIWALLEVADGAVAKAIPAPWLTIVVYVVVVVVSFLFADVVRRTPLSLPLAGRPWRDRRPPRPAPAEAAPAKVGGAA